MKRGVRGLSPAYSKKHLLIHCMLTSMTEWTHSILIAYVYVFHSDLDVPDHIGNQLLHKPRILTSLLIWKKNYVNTRPYYSRGFSPPFGSSDFLASSIRLRCFSFLSFFSLASFSALYLNATVTAQELEYMHVESYWKCMVEGGNVCLGTDTLICGTILLTWSRTSQGI